MNIEVLSALSPLVSTIFDKLMSKKTLTDGEINTILLFSMAQDINELRKNFDKFSNTLNELRIDVTTIKAKVS